MRTFLLFLALIISFQLGLAAETEAEVSAAITQFLGDPLGDTTPGRLILKYGQESPDHEITLEDKFLPWLKAEPNPKCGPLLSTAFVAGDLQEQFRKKTGKSEPYAGVLAMIAVYEKLKADAGIEPVKEMEEMIELKKQDKLKAQLELL